MSETESVPEQSGASDAEIAAEPAALSEPAPVAEPVAAVAEPAAVVVPPAPPAPAPAPAAPVVSGVDESPKSRLVAILLCWIVGVFGVHRFYVGKNGTGVAMIFTLGGLGVWVLIDLIMIAAGSFRDKEGRPVTNWSPNNS